MSTPYTYASRLPSRSRISDRCGRPWALSDSVVNLAASFLTRTPDAATSGTTMAAASTPATAAKTIRSPTIPVRVKNVSPRCTRPRVRRVAQ